MCGIIPRHSTEVGGMTTMSAVAKGGIMPELRANGERCSKALPPDSLEVRTVTYEFAPCTHCVGAICPPCPTGADSLRPERIRIRYHGGRELPIAHGVGR